MTKRHRNRIQQVSTERVLSDELSDSLVENYLDNAPSIPTDDDSLHSVPLHAEYTEEEDSTNEPHNSTDSEQLDSTNFYNIPVELIPLSNKFKKIGEANFSIDSNFAQAKFIKKPLSQKSRVSDVWINLSSNTNSKAIELLSQFPDHINWAQLSKNPCAVAVHLIKRNADKVVYRELSRNVATPIVEWLIQNPQWIDWATFSENTNKTALLFLSQNGPLINYKHLSSNSSDIAVDLLLNRYKDQFWSGLVSKMDTPWTEWLMPIISKPLPPEHSIDWLNLSANTNPRAVELLRKNLDKIDWFGLAYNSCPDAIRLFEETPNIAKRLGYRAYCDEKKKWLNANVGHLDYVGQCEYWRVLSRTDDDTAIAILRDNWDYIDWLNLGSNPHPEAVNMIFRALS